MPFYSTIFPPKSLGFKCHKQTKSFMTRLVNNKEKQPQWMDSMLPIIVERLYDGDIPNVFWGKVHKHW